MRQLDSHNLVFLISQPRSGSTLLQHLIGSHSEVHTLPEPWLMLHLVYGIRGFGLSGEYNAGLAQIAVKDFVRRIPGGHNVYWNATRSFACDLYGAAMEGTGKKYFLDKTPRYYFIIPELLRCFPRAKFIFLVRNPLAVLASLLNTSVRGNWPQLLGDEDRKHDLVSAPDLILEGVELAANRGIKINYEDLIQHPTQTLHNICNNLELNFEEDMLEYGGIIRFKETKFIDPKSIYKHHHPVTDYLDEWKTSFNAPQLLHIAQSYLGGLGYQTVQKLGYDYDELAGALHAQTVKGGHFVVPYELLSAPAKELPWWDRLKRNMYASLQQRGTRATLRQYARVIIKGK